MYPLTPLKVFVLDRVLDQPACVARMERMLHAIGYPADRVVTITDANFPDVVAELNTLWPPQVVPPGQVRSYMRPLVFTLMDLTARRPDVAPLLARCPAGTSPRTLTAILGQLPLAIDQHPHHRDQENDCVCWPTYNFGTVQGCSHGCLYCGDGREGKFLTITLNLEQYMDEVVAPIIEANPWNRVFRMILNGADLVTLEPEYGLHELFTRTLARYEDRFGHFHTASANVDWLADLPHRDRLVGVWSTTPEAIARDIEPGVGSAVDRLDAARRVQDMGIPVRIKFKPVIPIRNWREEYASILREVFARTRPESVGFGMFMWHTVEKLESIIPNDLLDTDCLDAARRAAAEMKDVRTGPYPHEVRKEIYSFLITEARRWDADVPLYISTESRRMWDELKDSLGQDPRTYICACSSVAVPGRRLALSPGFRASTYNITPI